MPSNKSSTPDDKTSGSDSKEAPRPRSDSLQKKFADFVKSFIWGKDEPKFEAFVKVEEQPSDTSSNSSDDNTKEDKMEVDSRPKPVITEITGRTIEYFAENASEFVSVEELRNPKYMTSMNSDLAKIGEGSFSIVKREHIAGNNFAVKYFKGEAKKEEIVTAYKEAQLLAALKHENVVKYIGILKLPPNTKETFPFCLVMELCEHSLHVLIHGGKAISPQQEISILNQIATGLEYVHSKQIVHRDIKPKNILIRSNGSVAIADFGVAKRSIQARETQSTGDIFYSPPECLIDGKYSPKTDVWSFGVVIWELLTRVTPFKDLANVSFGAKLAARKIRFELPPQIAEERPEIKALMEECLNFDDDLRPNFTTIRAKLAACK